MGDLRVVSVRQPSAAEAVLEDFLGRVRRGEITEVVVAGIAPSENIEVRWSTSTPMRGVAALAYASAAIVSATPVIHHPVKTP